MHEFSVTSSIIEILKKIAEEKKVSKILKVNFLLSSLGGIEPESIKFYFNFLAKDDELLKEAELFFEKSFYEYKCSECGFVFKEPEMTASCKKCGSSNLVMIPEDEIRIISIDV